MDLRKLQWDPVEKTREFVFTARFGKYATSESLYELGREA